MANKKGTAYWTKKLIGNGGVFNDYVKWRDAVDNINGKPICECITCGKQVSGRNLHAGHYVSRRVRRVAFDPHNVHAQCAYCNKYLNGNPIIYRKKIKELYGQKELDRLEAAVSMVGKSWKPFELEAMYTQYRNDLKELSKTI